MKKIFLFVSSFILISLGNSDTLHQDFYVVGNYQNVKTRVETGFKYEEIAQKMDMPLGTIKSKIHHARKELKRKIKAAYQVNHFSEMIYPNPLRTILLVQRISKMIYMH